MKCLNCGSSVEEDDNFCPVCGHWTAKGYSFFNKRENVTKMLNGYEIRQDNRLSVLISLISVGIILFIGMLIFRGNNLFKPIIFIKKQIDSYNYGYRTSIMKTDNIYNEMVIDDIDAANAQIKKDFDSQIWKCMHDIDTYKIEEQLQEDYSIISVNFCDISHDEVVKIKNVIDKMYTLFPIIKGGLTNITITNTKDKSEYIAYFQPMYQFVNPHEDINIYNKVNKSQILLNSYYFLNNDILSKDVSDFVGEGFYVDDATWESTIAHEFGHFITFKTFLKEKHIDNITFVNLNNENVINNAMIEYDSGIFSRNIVGRAIDSYNKQYNKNVDVETFTSTISKYAAVKNSQGDIIFDETIAEAIHDYYLHERSAKPESLAIVAIVREML